VARLYYVDTSAYLCLLLGEERATEVQRELHSSSLVSSVLLVLESRRNLIRLSRAGVLSPPDLHRCLKRLDEDLDAFMLRDLTLDLCRSADVPVVTTPRSLDLAHLSTALWFHRRERLTRFVSLDEDQNQAARELALPT
jgi:hypothetical protein